MEYLNELLQQCREHWQQLWTGEQLQLPREPRYSAAPERKQQSRGEKAEEESAVKALAAEERDTGERSGFSAEAEKEAAEKAAWLQEELWFSLRHSAPRKEQPETPKQGEAALFSAGSYLQRALRQLEQGSRSRREQSIVIRQSAAPDEDSIAPALEISRLFERDARRYDGEFALYD